MRKIFIIMLLFAGLSAEAQNLSQMPEAKRNKKLVQTAKEAVKKYAPDYYKYTAGKYTIEFCDDNDFGDYRAHYWVRFMEYDREEEYFRDGCAVLVQIWDDNHIAWRVGDGHGYYIPIPDKPLTRGEQVKTLKYQRLEPRKPKLRPDGRMGYSFD